jgi:SAM-dependent methyltransferase
VLPSLHWSNCLKRATSSYPNKGKRLSRVAAGKKERPKTLIVRDLAMLNPQGGNRGYDAKLFASLGLEAWGIDISPSAVAAAKAWLASLPSPPENVRFEELDFFKFDPPSDGDKFDVAYDYTFVDRLESVCLSCREPDTQVSISTRFFCALPADLHKAWAESYARVIKPSGH